jgi:hypothetical protein
MTVWTCRSSTGRLRADNFECPGRKTPAHLAAESRNDALKQCSTDYSRGEGRMTRNAALELPSVRSNYKLDSLVAKNAAVSRAVDDMARVSFGVRGKIRRSEARAHLRASLWLTSLRKPAVFEIVPTENISKVGIQMVSEKFWQPAELVLVSSPPGFFVQGSVVYCKKLPSDDHLLGIRLDASVEHWIETLGLGESRVPQPSV